MAIATGARWAIGGAVMVYQGYGMEGPLELSRSDARGGFWQADCRCSRLKTPGRAEDARRGDIRRPLFRLRATLGGNARTREARVIDLAFQSTLTPDHREALERLMFFNRRQREAETAVTRAVEMFGSPTILSEPSGVRVAVGACPDVQCLFAIERGRRSDALAGMVIYLRTSLEEVLVLHIAVADRYGRRGLEVVAALVRTVRAAAERLRGVERMTLLDLQGRELKITIRAVGSPPVRERQSTSPRMPESFPARAS
jgi:hypothetical protein